jgi:nucleoside-diphosphate-sugar epimerase
MHSHLAPRALNLADMNNLINTEAELEDRLSRPSDADIASVKKLEGDILILGAGGKMGPSLARLARRAVESAGVSKRVIAVARFTDQSLTSTLRADGIEVIAADLLEPGALPKLPEVANVIFMAARKFGTSGAEYLTWAMNTYLPGLVAERYRDSRIVSFSTGNVYPLRRIAQGGATEDTRPAPVGEYAQSALGRERMFEYGSNRWGTKSAILRLNYANDLRYGVLVDIGRAVYERRPVNVRMGLVNVIWQGDANSVCLRSFAHCQSPPQVINLTGPETLAVRAIAEEFAKRFGEEAQFDGEEADTALISDARLCSHLFGHPWVTVQQLIEWTANWIKVGGSILNKPTHFEVRDGKF